ncbi:MAG: chemotaxis protein CheW [Leptolyngbyaceae cyanobacterium]
MYNPELSKYVSFQIANYWYVIPVDEILKIVNCPSPNQGGVVGLGVVQLGPHTIQLLDLYQIFGLPPQTNAGNPAFLIVLQNKNNQLWGVALETPPDLIELLPTVLKPVSLTERFTPQTPWISHVGVATEQQSQRTFLQLDLQALLQQKTGQLTHS